MPAQDSTVPTLLGSIDSRALRGPARDFAAFCERELERRRDSEPDFDPTLYDEAVRLVMQKLVAGDAEAAR